MVMFLIFVDVDTEFINPDGSEFTVILLISINWLVMFNR